MKLITNIQHTYLSDILFKKGKNFKEIKAAVAYCKNYELFKYCKRNEIKLDYYVRLDESINLELENLKNYSDYISVHIISGTHFHPKVIWCYNYGAYIGSANLTKEAWEKNIECGLWLTHKELENNDLISSLEKFFEHIEKIESIPLSKIPDFTIQKLNEHKQKSQFNKGNLLEKLGFQIFKGLKSKNENRPTHEKVLHKNGEESFYFFEGLRKEFKKREGRSGLKMSKPSGGKYKNCISIYLKPIGYKNHIRAYRTDKYKIVQVYYGFKKSDKKYFDKLKKEKMADLIEKKQLKVKKRITKAWDMGFVFLKDRGTEKKDKKWIMNRVFDLLKALRNSN